MSIIEEQSRFNKGFFQWTFIKYGLLLIVIMAAPSLVTMMDQEACKLYFAGEYEKCLPLTEKMLWIQQLTMSDADPRIAETCYHLGMVYDSKNRFGDAQKMYDRAINIWRKSKDRESRIHISNALAYKARSAALASKNELSKDLYKEAIALQKQIFGTNHEFIAMNLISFSSVECDDKEFSAALESLEEALDMQTLPDGLRGTALYWKSVALIGLEKYIDAKEALLDSIKFHRKVSDKDSAANALDKYIEILHKLNPAKSVNSQFKSMSSKLRQTGDFKELDKFLSAN